MDDSAGTISGLLCVARAPFSRSQESKVLETQLLMLKSEGSESKLKLWTLHAGMRVL
jgi:hypothetical protein